MKPSKTLQNKINLINQISKVFDKKKLERLARKTGFVQRKSTLTGMDFFLLCVFAHQYNAGISLEELCNELYKRGKCIAKQSLQERFNDAAVCFMQKMVGEALSQKLNIQASMKHPFFKRIIICDSTMYQLPEPFAFKYRGNGGGASVAGIKLQYSFDLLTHNLIAIEVQQAIEPDCKYKLEEVKKNDLRIEDLGYCQLQRFQQIEKTGAFYLSRLKFNIKVYTLKEQEYIALDLLKIQQQIKSGERIVLQVYLGLKEKLPARLILEKVPPCVANEKRRKLKADKQNKRKNLSKERLAFCDINAYITNTTQDQLPAYQAHNYYRLRWQIEILFKAWKSVYKIDQIKKMKLQHFECINYGALLLTILTTQLLSYSKNYLYAIYKKELSEFKMFKTIKTFLPELYFAINHSLEEWKKFLNKLETILQRNCIKQKKRNKLTPFMILNFSP